MNARALDDAHVRMPDIEKRLARTQDILRREKAQVRRTGRPVHPLARDSARDPFAQIEAFDRALRELERARHRVVGGA